MCDVWNRLDWCLPVSAFCKCRGAWFEAPLTRAWYCLEPRTWQALVCSWFHPWVRRQGRVPWHPQRDLRMLNLKGFKTLIKISISQVGGARHVLTGSQPTCKRRGKKSHTKQSFSCSLEHDAKAYHWDVWSCIVKTRLDATRSHRNYAINRYLRIALSGSFTTKDLKRSYNSESQIANNTLNDYENLHISITSNHYFLHGYKPNARACFHFGPMRHLQLSI